MTDDTQGTSPKPVETVASQAYDLGGRALADGRFGEAERVFRGLVEMTPEEPQAFSHLAVALMAQGNRHDAERCLRRATELAPQDAANWLNLGKLYLAMQRTRRAQQALAEAERLAPDNVDVRYLSASVHRARGDLAGFENDLRHVIDRQPDHGAALNDLGCLLAEGRTRLGEAIELLRGATAASPDAAGPAVNLGNALYLAEDLDAAHAVFAGAAARHPTAAEAFRGLAMIERRQLHLAEAERHARAYGKLVGNAADARNLLGTVLREQGEFASARKEFEAALAADPASAQAAANLAMLELLLGEWASGLERYEARWRDPAYAARRNYMGRPHWDGSAGNGRRILLFAEQGFGDTLQFCRFARDVRAKGFEVFLETWPALRRLLGTLDPDITLVAADGHATEVDVIAPLMSLPYLLGIDTPERVSGVPYLSVPSDGEGLEAAFDRGARLRVGLNWRGNPRHLEDTKRSLLPSELAPFGGLADVQFVDLDLDSAGAPQELPIEMLDVAERIDDFADTAALMRQLDLVVTVDTATAHLAGALGVPCWLLLPHVPDWRWLTAREDTPWYDSVRLFRQPRIGDWSDVVARVTAALNTAAPR